MAWWHYAAYLGLVLASSLLIAKVANLKISIGRFARALAPVFIIFVLWDIAAVYLGHWQFGISHMTGIVLLNQPLEELLFFIVVPFFYVVAWECSKKYLGK
jgi:lycopene cyclase domain-containing protein